MRTEQIGNLTIHMVEDFDKAAESAYRYALNSMADVVPVVLFRQGDRYHLSGALPYSLVAKLLYSQSADKKKADVESVSATMNRPLDKSHTDEIAKYLGDHWREKYVLGSLTLNIRDPLAVFTARGLLRPVQLGYLLLPRTASISITDGQHRQAAIRKILDSLPNDDAQKLALDCIAVDITNETEITQIHQDFADASKTKPLPPGLLAVYDMRNPANRVVKELEKSCTLLRGRIDAASKTISKNSSMLFTANQVRQFVKVFLTGSWQMASAQFEKSAMELIGKSDEDFAVELAKAVEYLNALTEAIPVWREIAGTAKGIPSNRIRDLRTSGYVCLSASGLVILGQVGHELFKQEEPNWKAYVNKLGEIDWSKEGPLWQGNVVSPDKKILIQQNLIRVAIGKVRDAIGWTIPAEETTESELADQL